MRDSRTFQSWRAKMRGFRMSQWAMLQLMWIMVLLVENNAVDGLEIVVLGDSFASGVGARDKFGFFNYLHERPIDCVRSPTSYAALFAQAVGASQFTNVACGGGGIRSILSERRLRDIPKWPWKDCPKSGDSNQYTVQHEWYCEQYAKPQIEAITNTTDLVIIAAGGNDSGTFRVVEDCFFPFSANEDSCESSLNRSRTRIEAGGIIETRIKEALVAIGGKLHSNARVVWMYYPPPVLDVGYQLGQMNPNPDLQARELVAQFNRAISNGVTEAVSNSSSGNFAVVYPFTPDDFAGHEIDPRLGPLEQNKDGWLIEPLFDVRSGPEFFHLNQQGHQGLAQAMLQRKNIFGLSS